MSDLERLLIYVDLLGFKRRVQNMPLEDCVGALKALLYGVYAGAIRSAFRHAPHEIERFLNKPNFRSEEHDLTFVKDDVKKQTGFNTLLLSDTLVLYSDSLRPDAPDFAKRVTSLIQVCRILMLTMFECGLPARGAAGYGEFHADTTNSIFCGKALVEAYEVAESQEWIGLSICNSLEKHVSALVNSFSFEEFTKAALSHDWSMIRPDWEVIRYDVPSKTGLVSRWVVNWATAWNAGGPVRDDFFEEQLTGNRSADVKYENTLRYLQWFHRRVMAGQLDLAPGSKGLSKDPT